jgi:hypothetical protein
MGTRTKRFRAALLIAVIAAGLVGLGSSPASAAPIVQDGPVNYIGPGPCPAGTTDCTIATGDVDVVQEAPTSGKNTVDCRGASCRAVQSGSTATATPQNTAACNNATTAASSDQRCEVSQDGGANSLTATLSASPTTGGAVNLANVLQQNEQRFVTSQTGNTNSLTVQATIDQQATSIVDATTPVSHVQRTLVQSQNTMTATTSNTADLQLDRTQNSTATGATPTQQQDDAAGSETDGAIVGLGSVRLVAKTPGTNAIKIRGADTKNQAATSLNLGQATQQQGHDTGGWLVDLSGTDTGVANTGGAADVDLGTPGSTDGIVKSWTQTAGGLLGGAIAKDQDQIDEIRLPLIGKSPMNVLINGINRLRTDEGGHELCRASSEGHAQVRAQGRLVCDMQAGSKVRNDQVSWDAQTWDVDVECEVNTDACPGGTITTARKGVDIKIWGADKKSGVIPVAILSQPDDGNAATVDDATTVDPASVCFGEPDEALASERDCTLSSQASLTDVDNDGDTDLKLHYEAAQTGIDGADATACLVGETYSGDEVEGCGPLPKG